MIKPAPLRIISPVNFTKIGLQRLIQFGIKSRHPKVNTLIKPVDMTTRQPLADVVFLFHFCLCAVITRCKQGTNSLVVGGKCCVNVAIRHKSR